MGRERRFAFHEIAGVSWSGSGDVQASAIGEFRGFGPVVVGAFADVGALLWRLLACDRPGRRPPPARSLFGNRARRRWQIVDARLGPARGDRRSASGRPVRGSAVENETQRGYRLSRLPRCGWPASAGARGADAGCEALAGASAGERQSSWHRPTVPLVSSCSAVAAGERETADLGRKRARARRALRACGVIPAGLLAAGDRHRRDPAALRQRPCGGNGPPRFEGCDRSSWSAPVSAGATREACRRSLSLRATSRACGAAAAVRVGGRVRFQRRCGAERLSSCQPQGRYQLLTPANGAGVRGWWLLEALAITRAADTASVSRPSGRASAMMLIASALRSGAPAGLTGWGEALTRFVCGISGSRCWLPAARFSPTRAPGRFKVAGSLPLAQGLGSARPPGRRLWAHVNHRIPAKEGTKDERYSTRG
jgi:hypothetical protein